MPLIQGSTLMNHFGYTPQYRSKKLAESILRAKCLPQDEIYQHDKTC